MSMDMVAVKGYTDYGNPSVKIGKGQMIVSVDNDLMLRFKAGDEAAFEVLVVKHKLRVLNTIYRFIGRQDGAEDLAQEVFLSLYRAACRYQPRAKFTTYLYRIVANKCFNYVRRRRLVKFLSLDFSPANSERNYVLDPVDPRSNPEQQSEQRELAKEIKDALHSLPVRQRLVVVMKHYNGFSYLEISEALSLPLPAVKSLLHRAMMSLRVKLKNATIFKRGK